MPMVERLVTKSDIVLNYRDAADSGLVAIGDEVCGWVAVALRLAALATHFVRAMQRLAPGTKHGYRRAVV